MHNTLTCGRFCPSRTCPRKATNQVARPVARHAVKASAIDKTKAARAAKSVTGVEDKAQALKVLEKETASTSNPNFLIYIGGAVAVGAGIFAWKGPVAAEEYFAAYLLEQSLSIDNLFVFLLCFNFFKTPRELQDKVLGYGIYSAAVMRLFMILAGVQLVENFKPLLLVFAGILLYSAYGIIFGGDENGEDEDLSENPIVKTINKVFTVTDSYRGDRFFITEADVFKVTPLFVVLAVIEISDVIFAVDSIPAIFGVTLDPVVIYTSNIAAILSLRAMYGFVATVIAELKYLDKAVAGVLAFIAAKMILEQLPGGGIEISTTTSLIVVASALGLGTAASLWLPDPEAEAVEKL